MNNILTRVRITLIGLSMYWTGGLPTRNPINWIVWWGTLPSQLTLRRHVVSSTQLVCISCNLCMLYVLSSGPKPPSEARSYWFVTTRCSCRWLSPFQCTGLDRIRLLMYSDFSMDTWLSIESVQGNHGMIPGVTLKESSKKEIASTWTKRMDPIKRDDTFDNRFRNLSMTPLKSRVDNNSRVPIRTSLEKSTPAAFARRWLWWEDPYPKVF